MRPRRSQRRRPGFQPGFEEADTSVQAAVPLYGIYDMRDWDGRGGPAYIAPLVEKTVLKVTPASDPELWRRASPISWVGPAAPPMMIVHGTNDSLVPVDGARRMAARPPSLLDPAGRVRRTPLRPARVRHLRSLRTRYTVRAIERFLAYVRAGLRLGSAAAGSGEGAPAGRPAAVQGSVTAPRSAPVTSRAYLARTPVG